ncbi:ATP-dependent Clp protease ATP-binding subunit ClpA [Candidatus Magnetomoraceae bacterium gMMP-1]
MINKDLELTLGVAVKLARELRHEYVCVEHMLFAVLHDPMGIDIINNCNGNISNIKNNLREFFNERLERMPSDNHNYVLQQSIGFHRVVQRAVQQAKAADKTKLDIADILISLFEEQDSYAVYFLSAEGITRLDVMEYVAHGISKTSKDKNSSDSVTKKEKDKVKKKKEKTNPLKVFTVNLVKKAEEGRIDPLIGRKYEVERTLQVLCRRRKNNPVYVGDPGVGKTAMAEGLALKIHEGKVPDILNSAEIFSLDMGALLAGTKFRGDFEQRLKEVVESIMKKPKAILFIDEIHTIVGAGATSSGSMDASNILKPFLASGELKCIGSSTYEEYKNHFEKDRALSRRFEKIEIAEPSVRETIKILKGLKSRYEEHHNIKYTINALKAAAELSAKHINDRYLPDKAIDIIDEAGAYLRLSGNSRRKKIHPKDIEKIVAKTAKIPPQSVSSSDRSQLKDLETLMKKVLFGQDEAIHALVKAIKRSRAGLSAETRPIGTFLFTGPTGVGKTEAARQLANNMGVNFMRFDMSEYMEKHSVARLIGAPPGYIGFNQGGLLTDGVRKHPYSVLLLDEIEKAHPDLFNILLQVMDYATLTDNNGKKADFRNVIFIMTSNAGAREMSSRSIGFGEPDKDTEFKGKKAIEKLFTPEFRNRLDAIITFHALSVDIMEMIVDKFINELNSQLIPKNVIINLSPKAKTWLAKKGYDPVYGARPLTRLIQKEIKDELTDEILFGKLLKGGSVVLGIEKDKLKFTYVLNG